ncbi:MAG: matrixin family metalloprotease [Phycisphaerales bacterium]|nr:matrixin family metalloprotease [Phycisphaerales bacterium]MCB9856532.1 matrixin family metalloprotease [Phycisphaerales bacterium]
MQNCKHCLPALLAGIIGVVGAIGFFGVAPVQEKVSNNESVRADARAVVRDMPPDAEAIEGALGRMIVADTGRRLGEDRLAQIATAFEDQCDRPLIPVPQLCFAPGTPDEVIAQFAGTAGPRFFQIDRWSVTASGATGGAGDPITLTYSFPPDGTTIPMISGVSFPSGINTFRAWMNSLYGSQLVWQPIFEQVFDRWSEVSGVTYVYEPADDGAQTNFSPGILGVRGDLRICGKVLDGNSGVLAYNNFPDDGDMVFDAGDSFFNVTSGGSLRLRNVAAHEHGHGLGELHVCPLEEIKLMEPIASTAFDGPQHDDIRNAHKHYGDPFEPDNSPAQATDLGFLSIPSSQTLGQLGAPIINFGATLSIDANGEQDYFGFSVASPASLSVTVTPIGTNYADAPQECSSGSAFCCSGTFTNSLISANLGVEVIGSDGSTVLASATAAAAGAVETISNLILNPAGDYYVRVFETNTPNQPQLYQVSLSIDNVPFLPLAISIPGGAPTTMIPGQPTSFNALITTGDDSLVGGSVALFYRFDGGAFASAPGSSLGGGLYELTLPPANCGDSPEFYVQAEGTTTGIVTAPTAGASAPFTAIVGTFATQFDDNGETNPGWTVSGDATDGQWDRGVPENNLRGDPPMDFDGSGQCWLTDNDPNTTNSDVDGGSTILTSPVIDVSGLSGATIAYARWFDNTAGSNAGQDTMVVEVSDNAGGSWTTLETVGPTGAESSGGWFAVEYVISDFVGVTSSFRIRFTASDLGAGSVVEAGIDAIVVRGVDCNVAIEAPLAPTGVSAADGASCDGVLVTWNASASADDYEVYRNSIDDSGSATLIASGVAATSYDDAAAAPGVSSFYWVRACNGAGCSGFSTPDSGVRADVPAEVTNVSATSGTVCGAIDIGWDSVVGATQYRVYRNTIADFGTAGEIALVGSTETSIQDAAVNAVDSYFYWVVAENGCGAGVESIPATGDAGILADFNLDGVRDGLDVNGMVLALLGDSSLMPCADLAAPMGTVDAADLAAFVSLLVGP